MKNVTYRKKDLLAHRGRFVAIRELHKDQECDTYIDKNFVYLLNRVDQLPDEKPVPTIRLIKLIDTTKQTETFRLKVKGEIFVKKARFIYRIKYCHSLKVRMLWKVRVLSSKPAALA